MIESGLRHLTTFSPPISFVFYVSYFCQKTVKMFTGVLALFALAASVVSAETQQVVVGMNMTRVSSVVLMQMDVKTDLDRLSLLTGTYARRDIMSSYE